MRWAMCALAESRKLAQDGFEPVLAKTRWCVLKRKENLTEKQAVRLRDLLKYNLQTVRAYLLKEQFQAGITPHRRGPASFSTNGRRWSCVHASSR